MIIGGLPLRVVAGACAALVLAAACDVQVRERFRSDTTALVTTTTEAAEDDVAVTTSVAPGSLVGVPIDIDDLESAGDVVSVLGRPVDMRATLRWQHDWSDERITLDLGTTVSLDLTLLRVNEIERLGLIAEDETLDPRIRFYSVRGDVRHDLSGAGCEAADDEESCEIAFVTDGAMHGLASRRDDVVNLVLVWETLGRGDEQAIPAVAVEISDSSGETTPIELRITADALRRAGFVGGLATAVRVGRDEGRTLTSSGGEGILTVVDVG